MGSYFKAVVLLIVLVALVTFGIQNNETLKLHYYFGMSSMAIPVYGIVSTGELWQFAKLEDQVMTRHPLPFSAAYPGQLAGILNHIFGECERHAAKAFKQPILP